MKISHCYLYLGLVNLWRYLRKGGTVKILIYRRRNTVIGAECVKSVCYGGSAMRYLSCDNPLLIVFHTQKLIKSYVINIVRWTYMKIRHSITKRCVSNNHDCQLRVQDHNVFETDKFLDQFLSLDSIFNGIIIILRFHFIQISLRFREFNFNLYEYE